MTPQESKKIVKYLDFAGELKKLWNMGVKRISRWEMWTTGNRAKDLISAILLISTFL